MDDSGSKLNSTATIRPATRHEGTHKLSTENIRRVATPSPVKKSFSMDESVPNYAKAIALNWLEKKFNLVKPLPPQQFEQQSRAITRQAVPEFDSFMNLLRLEHRSNPNGRQVIRLPKTPYGKHRSYNGDAQFMKHHIIDNLKLKADESLSRELSEIARKFKLVDKRKKPKFGSCRQDKPVKLRQFEDHYEVALRTGNLVCPISKSLAESYENDKRKYKDVATPKVMVQTFRGLQSPNQTAYRSQSRTAKVSNKEVLRRLYQTPQGVATESPSKIERKYKKLMEKTLSLQASRERLVLK